MIDTVLDNRYRLCELLGSGTTAKVYRAHDLESGRDVALKLFDEAYLAVGDALRLFEREITAVARLETHPNLLNYYGGSLKEGCRYLVMDIAKGETLMHYLNRSGGKLSLDVALNLFSQLMSALSYIHKRGVIHRDIKPQNIRISSDGRLKLCDFGIAVVVGAESSASGKAVGTVNYISPEQAKGIEVSPASDLYSGGVVLYEMLTGQLPFTSDKASAEDRINEIIRKHLKEAPIRPSHYNPNIPEALEQIVLKAMNKNPAARFQSAEEILRYLALYRQNPGVLFDFELPDEEFDSGAALPKNTAPAGFKPRAHVKERAVKGGKEKKEKSLDRRTLLLISLFFSLSLIAAFVIYFVMQSLFFYEGNSRTVLTRSDLLYLPYTEELSDKLIADGYELTVEYRYSNAYPAGTVIAQEPLPRAVQSLSKDEAPKLHLTVSMDQAMAILKEYRGMDYREVMIELQSLGFSVSVKKVFSERDAGEVLLTSPSADEIAMVGDTVLLTVSKGQEVKYAYMPSLLGVTLAEAKARLNGLGIPFEVVYAESDQPYGTVIYQSRSYGEKIPTQYYSVVLKVSNTVQVPDTYDDAENSEILPES